MANTLLREISDDEKEWWIKFSYESAERERNAIQNAALMQARKDGLQQGMQQGRLAEKIENARNFIKLGLPLEQVAIGTQLPIDKIERIANGFL